MTIRVHELAKEFKISTAALKKHLHDMGVDVKSHMSPLGDDVVSDIRSKFNIESAAVRKREKDRRNFQKKLILDKKKKELEKKLEAERKEKEEKEKKIQKFVEKEITKKERKANKKKESKFDKEKPVYKKEPADVLLDADKLNKLQGLEKKKHKEKKFEEKNKHLKAKLKHYSKGKKRKRIIPTETEEAEISKNVRKTLSKTKKRKKYKKEEKTQGIIDKKIVINEFTSVSELSKIIGVDASEIIMKFYNIGQMVTINQRLDKDSLEMICAEFDLDVEFQEEFGAGLLEKEIEVKSDDLKKIERPPIVTIMGHVDHGKTAILDYIRQSNVIAGESGGITQHIGAYQVVYNNRKITFLDTPGHEAFAAMRARGANVTDIAIIVVSAAESVKEQTIEAIDHAKAAGVTVIVAINKIDLKEANADRTIADIMTHNLILEGYGGEVLWVKCSAKTGEGIDELLDSILITAEMLELKAAENIPGSGIVIEAKKDQRKGTITTVLLQEGKMKKSEMIVCGATYGRIRKMENEREQELKQIGPSDVAIIYGLNDVPKAGDNTNIVEDEKIARQISSERKLIRHEREKMQRKTTLSNLFQKIKENKMSEIKLIVKADTDGSVEALCDSFQKLSNEEVMVNIIRKAVGGINEADINMATASEAIIIGFHVRASSAILKLADEAGVEINLYQIIYKAIEDIQLAMEGMLAPELKEVSVGSAEVRQVFKIKKVGQIAGCFVEKGKMLREAKLRLYRNDIMIHEGSVSSLKHYAEEVEEIKAGSECGIGIENYNDIKEGDFIEAFIIKEISRKLTK